MQTAFVYPPVSFQLTARRIVKSWTESPYDELPESPTLTRACVTNVYEGDLEGESWEEYLMLYRHRESCSFTSMERVIGTIDGRFGSFVMQGTGTYEHGIATGMLTIVPGSSTGELTGLRGEGSFITSGERFSSVTLHCTFGQQSYQ